MLPPGSHAKKHGIDSLKDHKPMPGYVAGNIVTSNANGLPEDSGTSLASILGGLIYQGTWNALTNTPALADGTGTQGHYYQVSVAGTQDLGSGSITFDVGDWVLHNGSIWQKTDFSHETDEDKQATGIYVSTTKGDDTIADGSLYNPFKTIQAAIDYAFATYGTARSTIIINNPHYEHTIRPHPGQDIVLFSHHLYWSGVQITCLEIDANVLVICHGISIAEIKELEDTQPKYVDMFMGVLDYVTPFSATYKLELTVHGTYFLQPSVVIPYLNYFDGIWIDENNTTDYISMWNCMALPEENSHLANKEYVDNCAFTKKIVPYYVSTDYGNDTTGDGSLARPYQTLAKVVEMFATLDIVEAIVDSSVGKSVYELVSIPANKTILITGTYNPYGLPNVGIRINHVDVTSKAICQNIFIENLAGASFAQDSLQGCVVNGTITPIKLIYSQGTWFASSVGGKLSGWWFSDALWKWFFEGKVTGENVEPITDVRDYVQYEYLKDKYQSNYTNGGLAILYLGTYTVSPNVQITIEDLGVISGLRGFQYYFTPNVNPLEGCTITVYKMYVVGTNVYIAECADGDCRVHVNVEGL